LHGQGFGSDDEKRHLLRYFQKIDRGLHTIFQKETAPLVLASAEFLWPIIVRPTPPPISWQGEWQAMLTTGRLLSTCYTDEHGSL